MAGGEDTAVVLRALGQWGDTEDFAAHVARSFTPDAEYVEDPSFPGAATHRGVDAITARWGEYAEVLGSEVSLDVEEVQETDAGVFVRFHTSGRATMSGMRYDHTWGYVFRVRDGKISYWRAYLEPDLARRALGLEPA